MTSTKTSKLFGGSGGIEFSDTHSLKSWGRITQIRVRHGQRVDAIATTYASGHYLSHGGTGGEESVITLAEDEFITGVEVRSGSALDSITFRSSNGKTYGPYGGTGGHATSIPLEGCVLQYFIGRSGSLIDAIGFAYGDKPPEEAGSLIRVGPYGGSGGSPFDDIEGSDYMLGNIKSIQVRSASRIDKIETTYANKRGGKPIVRAHGGDGGDLNEPFVLSEDEYITQIKGRFGASLDQIKFILNNGRESKTYGGNGGSPFTANANKSVLKALFGRSESDLAQLGFWFAQSEIERIEIQSLVFDTDRFNVVQMPPTTLMSVDLKNNQREPQTVSMTGTVSYTETTTTTISFTQGVSVEFTVGANIKKVVKLGLTVGYSAETTYTSGKSVAHETTDSFTFSATVPGNSTIVASCLAYQDRYDVPWTASALVYYQGQSEPTRVEELTGTLRGLKVMKLAAQYDSGPQ